jgi:hypothetical protein
MSAKKNVKFLVNVSVASAALMASLPLKAEVTPSQPNIGQRITLPENAVLKPAGQNQQGASTLQHDSHSSHSSHSSHDSHSSHSSGIT